MSDDNPQTTLVDGRGRRITYLRLAITDRCNLRCRYCRPENGVPFIPHGEILTFEELLRLVAIFRDMGVNKVRVTGGEPFSRRGCLDFLARLRKMPGIDFLHITTNGVKTGRFLDRLQDIGIDGINLSLDTLDPARFLAITRRGYLEAVLETLHGAVARGLPLKINSVVLADTTDTEIRALAGLAEKMPVTVRFIEKMPFSGGAVPAMPETGQLAARLRAVFPAMHEESPPLSGTARLFSLPGYRGKIGIIEGYSRKFCPACNKLRITPVGMLKACLYDNGVLDLKSMLRQGAGNHKIAAAVRECARKRFADGHAAQDACLRADEPSMSVIGG